MVEGKYNSGTRGGNVNCQNSNDKGNPKSETRRVFPSRVFAPDACGNPKNMGGLGRSAEARVVCSIVFIGGSPPVRAGPFVEPTRHKPRLKIDEESRRHTDRLTVNRGTRRSQLVIDRLLFHSPGLADFDCSQPA
jgi:hypothetical protein